MNAMIQVYALKIDFKAFFTNVRAQKIDDSTFKMFKILLTSF